MTVIWNDQRTVVGDSFGNRATLAHFGSEVAAEAALRSLVNCTRCYDCRDCIDCDTCTRCVDCRDCDDCVNVPGGRGLVHVSGDQLKKATIRVLLAPAMIAGVIGGALLLLIQVTR